MQLRSRSTSLPRYFYVQCTVTYLPVVVLHFTKLDYCVYFCGVSSTARVLGVV